MPIKKSIQQNVDGQTLTLTKTLFGFKRQPTSLDCSGIHLLALKVFYLSLMDKEGKINNSVAVTAAKEGIGCTSEERYNNGRRWREGVSSWGSTGQETRAHLLIFAFRRPTCFWKWVLEIDVEDLCKILLCRTEPIFWTSPSWDSVGFSPSSSNVPLEFIFYCFLNFLNTLNEGIFTHFFCEVNKIFFQEKDCLFL